MGQESPRRSGGKHCESPEPAAQLPQTPSHDLHHASLTYVPSLHRQFQVSVTNAKINDRNMAGLGHWHTRDASFSFLPMHEICLLGSHLTKVNTWSLGEWSCPIIPFTHKFKSLKFASTWAAINVKVIAESAFWLLRNRGTNQTDRNHPFIGCRIQWLTLPGQWTPWHPTWMSWGI